MNTTEASYSDMPISKIAATRYGLTRSVTADRRHRTARRDQSQVFADLQRQLFGNPGADDDTLAWRSEAVEATLPDVVRIEPSLARSATRNAAAPRASRLNGDDASA